MYLPRSFEEQLDYEDGGSPDGHAPVKLDRVVKVERQRLHDAVSLQVCVTGASLKSTLRTLCIGENGVLTGKGDRRQKLTFESSH